MSKVIITLAILALFSIASSASTSEESLSTLWGAWKSAHSKYYTPSEESHRFMIFKQNIVKIAKLNARNPETKFAINKFADLTSSEFKNKYLNGFIQPHVSNKTEFQMKSITGPLPTSFDWRTKGVGNNIKDQGGCGSCWAFSAIGAIEGLYKIKVGQDAFFSEQQLVDCDTYDSGCNGGLMESAFQYVIENTLEIDKDYPYTGRDGKCKHSARKGVKVISSYQFISQELSDVVAALVVQPLSVAIDATDFQFYDSGILTGDYCDPNALDHGVLILGYQMNQPIDYFIVKNSWGKNWGMNGYVNIEMGNTCGILEYVIVPQ